MKNGISWPVLRVIRLAGLPLLLGMIFPLILSLMAGVPPDQTLVLAVGTLVIEYGAAAAGTALGLPPAFTAAVVTLVAAAVVCFLFSLFELFASRSARVSRFLEHIGRRWGERQWVRRYGIRSLIPGTLVLGFYVCSPLAWILGWPKNHAIVLILCTFCIATFMTAAGGLGIAAMIRGG
jgi:hypothetical protein